MNLLYLFHLHPLPKRDMPLDVFGAPVGVGIKPCRVGISLTVDHYGIVAAVTLPATERSGRAIDKVFASEAVWRKIVVALDYYGIFAARQYGAVPTCLHHDRSCRCGITGLPRDGLPCRSPYLASMQRPALLIMIKNPIPGKTKTRLAAEVGEGRALRMYGKLLRYTQEQVLGLEETTRYLHYSEYVDTDDEWSNRDFLKLVQVGQDLGARMAAAFDHAFVRGHERVVIIGSDCPGLTTDLLRDAYAALTTHELVIGPATDGGYYLLGMRHPHPELFQEMKWSTDAVYEETLARARIRGLSVNKLPTLTDVDHLADWQSYGWEVPE